MKKTPFQKIKDELSTVFSQRQLKLLPSKWEKVGDVLIFMLDEELIPFEETIAEVYATVLSCKSVLRDTGGIFGEFREPEVRFVYGDENTVTVHKENGVKFKLDPAQVMFSSGNMSERKRMSELSCQGETVVDLFAGIGYFSVPIAVHSRPQHVFSCEWNPVAYSFLEENIELNKVSKVITSVLGDNRKVAPTDVADRVLMGFFGNTKDFLPVALHSLKNHTGIIHFHDKFPDEKIPGLPLSQIQYAADLFNRKVVLDHVEKVKSFAPGVSHYVLDVRILEK
jgi:tRNA wybutosine-synthesizing protein 2